MLVISVPREQISLVKYVRGHTFRGETYITVTSSPAFCRILYKKMLQEPGNEASLGSRTCLKIISTPVNLARFSHSLSTVDFLPCAGWSHHFCLGKRVYLQGGSQRSLLADEFRSSVRGGQHSTPGHALGQYTGRG